MFAWIDAEKAEFPITKLCQYLQVSPSGFYAARGRPESSRTQTDHACASWCGPCSTRAISGMAARVFTRISSSRRSVSRKRVIRLMQEDGLEARARKRFKCTTMSDHAQPVAGISWTVASRPPVRTALGRRHDGVRSAAAASFIWPWSSTCSRGSSWAGPAPSNRHVTIKALDMAPAVRMRGCSDQGCTYASEDYQTILGARGRL